MNNKKNNALKEKRDYDILNMLNSISNFEIFTPFEITSSMVELLPEDVFKHPEYKFLDPCVKSGIFLREIVYKLDEHLPRIVYRDPDSLIEYDLNDKKSRTTHILRNMIYGIAISELTAYVTRRTLYGVMEANADKIDEYLESKILAHRDEELLEMNEYYEHDIFNTDDRKGYETEGNIFYPINETTMETEDSHHPFINNTKHKLINKIKEEKMKFDVIIGNPPYQENDGGGHGDSSRPIYNHFIENAKKLSPKYLSFIVPSRWMKGGKGLDKFRAEMMNDRHIQAIVDFQNEKDLFPNVNIDGGVCYFLWNQNYNGLVSYSFNSSDGYKSTLLRSLKSSVSETIIRDDRSFSIVEKAASGSRFSEIVLSRNPFGIPSDLFNNSSKYEVLCLSNNTFEDSLKIHGVKGKKGGAKRITGFIKNNINKNIDHVESYNVLFSKAFTTTAINPPQFILSNKKEICTETFLCIGNFKNKKERDNCAKYIETKFFKSLLFFNRSSINISKGSFDYIPLLDFSIEWNDDMLFKKFQLSDKEIEYINNLFV